MKILFISEYYPPDQVGASTRIKNLKNSLKSNHEITVLTASPHYPNQKSKVRWFKPIRVYAEESNIKIIRIWMPTLNVENTFGRILNYLLFSFLSLIAIPLVKKPDVVWGTSPNVFAFIPIKIYSIIFKSKCILNVDDLWPTAPIEFGFLRNPILNWISLKLALISLNKVDGISAISDSLVKIVSNLTNVKNVQKVIVGVAESRLIDIEKKISSEDDTVNKPVTDGELIFMYSGILGPAYDFHLLILTFEEWVKNSKSNVKLIIRGNGPEEKNIKKYMSELNVKSTELVVGYLSEKELNKTLFQANAFILPMKDNFISKTAIPTKLLEYIAFGKPIFVFGQGEPKRLIVQSEMGVSRIHRKKFLIEGYSSLLDFYQNNQEIHLKGLEFIKNYYSSNTIRKQSLILLNNVVSHIP